MTKSGPSIYYASDKNIFDALNQPKVDNETVRALFERRNIVSSKRTPREELSRYFSRLTHDSLDHADIALRLGVLSRRERITSVDLTAVIENDQLIRAIESLCVSIRDDGSTAHVSRNGNTFLVDVTYTEIDYKRSEFSQLQHREGQIELIKSADGFVMRSTQSDYVNAMRDDLLGRLEKESKTNIKKSMVSLFDIQTPSTRSQFFYDLMQNLPGYVRRDVTNVYVHKAISPGNLDAEDDEEEEDQRDGEVMRIIMRGTRVTQSALLNDLLKEEKYYMVKVGWVAVETQGKGYGYDIEALFNDPRECTGFSYLLKGVFILEENGKLSKKRRPPYKEETDTISRAIESKARDLMKQIRAAHAA